MTQSTSDYLTRSAGSDEDRPKLPWVKFGEEGDSVTLVITDKGMAPDYEYKTDPNAPKVQKTWPNGDLKEFLVITGTLEAPARVGDGTRKGTTAETGTEVNVAVKGKLMTQAVAKAVIDAGKKDVDPGGTLWIKFTQWTTSNSGYDAKDFEARYKVGATDTSSFLASGGGSSTPAASKADDSAPPF